MQKKQKKLSKKSSSQKDKKHNLVLDSSLKEEVSLKKREKIEVSPKKSPQKEPVSEPKTMADLLKLEDYQLNIPQRGDLVKGKLISASKREILLDIGGKSFGIVHPKEIKYVADFIKELGSGDEIVARVVNPEDESGKVVLSLRGTVLDQKWEKVYSLLESKKTFTVKVINTARGGVLVDCFGLRGYIPASCLDSEFASNPQILIDKKVSVKVVELDKNANRLVLSQKEVSRVGVAEKIDKALESIKEGDVIWGKVIGVVPFGIFIEANVSEFEDVPIEGLVHISEIAWEKVDNPSDYYKVGDRVKLMVIGVNKKGGKCNFSIKRLTEDPWKKLVIQYKKDTKVKGKVSQITPFGIFVTLKKGVKGLVHISKIPVDMAFKIGDEVECLVESIDKKGRKIALSLVLKEKPVGYR